jgi:hypothetical protein
LLGTVSFWSAGRTLSDFEIPVETKAAQSTEQRMRSVTKARAWLSISDTDTTACFEALYAPISRALTGPYIDAVIMMMP